MVRANCRAQLTADDFDFIVRALSTSPTGKISLQDLLLDENERDSILDHDALSDALLEDPETLRVSPRLLFYVLCRRVLKATRVQSRESTDYIASMLENFLHSGRLHSVAEITQQDLRYLSDMLRVLMTATPGEAFLLRTHIANYALFLCGIFHEHVDRRARRGGPEISFYEEIGRSSFAIAAEHREAKRLSLDSVFAELADGFHDARLALNDLAERIFHLDTRGPRIPCEGMNL